MTEKMITIIPHRLWLVKYRGTWRVCRAGDYGQAHTNDLGLHHIILLPLQLIFSLIMWPLTPPSLVYDIDKGDLEQSRNAPS